MAILIGTDEAGYGPKLGPLTVCGTSWTCEDPEADLYQLLESIVCNRRDPDKLAICDSKQIYSPSGSIKTLESTVMTVLYGLYGAIPENSSQLGGMLGIDLELASICGIAGGKRGKGKGKGGPRRKPEGQGSGPPISLPLVADPIEIKLMAARWLTVCDQRQVYLDGVSARAVSPQQFNLQIANFGNKAELLSGTTFGIIKQLLQAVAEKRKPLETKIVCDKHGGRSKYLGMISHYLTDQFVAVETESRAVSSYSWREQENRFQIQFQTGGESFLPTALSSMIAKYVREVSMEIWNSFWISLLPEIRPTRGYPVDARRFKDQIAGAQNELGIEDETIWRSR